MESSMESTSIPVIRHHLPCGPIENDQNEGTLRKWKRRILTSIGKIVVIKNLHISKLNHLF